MRSPSSIVRHCLFLAGLTAAALAAVPEAGAQDGAPCPPGGPTPTLTAEDRQAGAGATLTATHDIDIETAFPDGSSPDVQLSVPAGVHVKGSALISDTPARSRSRSRGRSCRTIERSAMTPERGSPVKPRRR